LCTLLSCYTTQEMSRNFRMEITVCLFNFTEQVLLEKLIVTHLVNIFPPFMEPECSVPRSRQPTIGPYPDPDDFVHNHTWYFFAFRFNIILLCTGNRDSSVVIPLDYGGSKPGRGWELFSSRPRNAMATRGSFLGGKTVRV